MEWLHPSDRKRVKSVLRRAREDVQPVLETVREQVPVLKHAVKEAELKMRGKWTAISESPEDSDAAELPVLSPAWAGHADLVEDCIKPPLPKAPPQPVLDYQKVLPDMLEDLVLIQKGGFGDIYRGWSRTWGLKIALKLIRGADRHTMKEMLKEATMMKLANFPYVLRLLGLYQKQVEEYVEYGLVMEYMPGGSLYTLFRSATPVPWALRFQTLHQVALGMNYLHTLSPPLLHLDLKPKNVLLDEHLDVRLTDFGLSKLKSITWSSSGGGVGGTLPYKPPESLKDINYTPTEPFDVYSFGILTWTVLAAEEPYPYADADNIKFQVPQGQRPDQKKLEPLDSIKMVPEAKALMRSCWDQKPDARPPFSECIKQTKPMCAAYEAEKGDAIRMVQDRLKCYSQEEILDFDSNFISDETLSAPQSSESVHPSFFASK
ncbi:receptor-interacting serine/threonine-protein kinase 4-like isoform X2 [Ambystoma mexicanum]|uniref:receptor-interacting serine/threonine-protein kinase 4-like isoform X2 n=1 Tax=Ambystoma mexicanum TaxID=8296 RepID=UPI0037E791E3